MEQTQRRKPMPDRRSTDNTDLSILVYRLDELVTQNKELKVLVESGFVKQEGRVSALETRVSGLEIFRAGVEERFKAATGAGGNDNLLKIIFIVLGLLGTALGIVGSGALKGLG